MPEECLGAATLMMLCARDMRLKQMLLSAFMVETDSMVTVQCWGRRSAGHSAGVADALLAVDEATTLFDIATYTYLDHCPGVKNPLADAVSRAQWDNVRNLVRPFRCARVEIPSSWRMRTCALREYAAASTTCVQRSVGLHKSFAFCAARGMYPIRTDGPTASN